MRVAQPNQTSCPSPECQQTGFNNPRMATAQELSDFLAGVERRAFKQAAFAVRDDHAALDIVQVAMLKLADN